MKRGACIGRDTDNEYRYERNSFLLNQVRDGDRLALEEVTGDNLGLVAVACKDFLGKGYEYEDLFQVGSLGLAKSILGFKPEFGIKLSTYAVSMITWELKRYIRNDTKARRKHKKEHRTNNVFLSFYQVIYQTDGSPITLEDTLRSNVELESDVINKQMLKESLDLLRPDEREVIEAYYFNDMTQAQVGKLCNITQVQVSRKLAIAMEKLKRYFKER